jgi:malto-oligosyltrehalose synthase/4-alpha-glucanotransferase
MYFPNDSYRVQLHKDFNFARLRAIVPYLARLGVRTLYASPIFEAVPGSMHGYDVLNPNRINPEIGTEDELRSLSAELRQAGIGWLQDIVPNHMAYDPRNPWLADVLTQGKASAYAHFFDIFWDEGEKLMAPFLGSSLEECVAKGELVAVQQDDKWFLDFSGNRFPLAPGTWPTEPPQGEALLELARAQHYRLCSWQETDRRINYRRFFTVNGLICLNMQRPEVFQEYHRLIAKLCAEGVFSGLRVDHSDGLFAPRQYLEELRALVGKDAYIVVEKILEPGEALPESWPIQGSTGYDFLGLANNLLTQEDAERKLTRSYRQSVGEKESIAQQLREKKALILYEQMRGELHYLTGIFRELLPPESSAPASLQLVIGETLVACPVYRFYGSEMPLPADEAKALEEIFKGIQARKPELREGLRLLKHLLLEKPLEGDADFNRRALPAYRRLMQFAGPLMAKGVEDTLMYSNSRFIGHNEVGDSLEVFGITPEEFHRAMLTRQSTWPLTMNATATHDTKRGEDARAVLSLLSELPAQWTTMVKQWQAINASLKQDAAPDAGDEYFLYQTLFATYPFHEANLPDYPERLKNYLQKALREAKRNSSWHTPDEAYEQGVSQFAEKLLQPEGDFLKSFLAFRDELLDCGMSEALSQLVLRLCCPGVADNYQGAELWDQSFVDPDNRRVVDYSLREKMLDDCQHQSPEGLWASRRDGAVKLWLLHRLLQLRKDDAELFEKGLYVPLRVTGARKNEVIAFARRHGRRWLLVAVPIHLAALGRDPLHIDWKDTRIELPPQMPQSWQHGLAAASGKADGSILLSDIFSPLPLAVLRLEQEAKPRSAGVLMPVFSLPSDFSIGDAGPGALRFARQLSRAGQSCWQILPLNPVSDKSHFSPYSSASTMAGNPLLISPEWLAQQGLLCEDELQPFRRAASNRVDYEMAVQDKCALLDTAFRRYKTGGFLRLRADAEEYRHNAAEWLEDFALFVAIRKAQQGKAWNEWEPRFRDRDAQALQHFASEHAEEIERICWEQFVFSSQWAALREHCRALGLSLIGDLPFYVSYDSADVWSHRDIFMLDNVGNISGVAGVPPDYFSETGQLWGMPTFRWDVLKSQGYAWWLSRLKNSLALCDLLRIDHFRAFASYWEVPAGEETAIHGRWLPGPGEDFFRALRETLGGLPFIAEDLGYEMDDVYRLRDAVSLPGMKVLQFAFGDNMPASVDIPHNYTRNCIAYTGTHDNNTTLGWLRQEAKPADRERLSGYAGQRVTEQNVTEVMARLAYASVAECAILPMQDVLHLGESERMNTPGEAGGSWMWRLMPGQFTEEHLHWLRQMTRVYLRW